MVGQGWSFRALRRVATAIIWGEFPQELALTQSTQPASSSACCFTPVSNSHSREPPAWTVVHRACGPCCCRAQLRVEWANQPLDSRCASYNQLETRFVPCATAWRSQSSTGSGKPFEHCPFFTLTRPKCGTSIKRVQEIRALIQSGRNWMMPPVKAFPRRSGLVLQWLAYSLSLLCWLEETVCWSHRGHRLCAKFRSLARFLPCSVSRGITNGSLSLETFGAVSDSLLRHGNDSTLTYLLTFDCATYFGITRQRIGGKGLCGGSIRGTHSWHSR